ncbi:MAG TPA: TRAP transporter substrate-binding protein [Virgibacillus sp.]|nr:TRAP transporter substrate-binding protein [Virgibacillus sp.]HLR68267.1 TRAP transporter substrate-binding protein [Virgibacillus sp.]
MRIKILSLAVVTAVVLILAACGSNNTSTGDNNNAQSNESAGDATTLKIGHLSPEESINQELAEKFKELVEEKTDGEVEVEIYPNGQLGGDREMLEAMQMGTMDLGIISSPPVSSFAPDVSVLDLPFVFNDWDHVFAFLESDVYDDFREITEEENIKTLSLIARGFRDLTNSKGPIETPDDLDGLKVRVLENSTYVDAYKALGANVQSMSWGDAYTALEQGTIDSQENSLDIIHDENVPEVQDYVSKTEMNFAFIDLMASKTNFDTWSEDVQKAIAEASEESAAYINEKTEEEQKEYEEKLEEKDMEFNEVDKDAFEEKVQGVYNDWKEEHDDEILKQIQELDK